MIAFANQKGGVAKTTTTLNLAVAFAESGHRVLCIDLDPQGNLTMSQGIDPDKVEKSLYDVLVDDMPIREIIQHREIDIAVASIDLAGAEIAMSTQIGRERSLQKALKEVADDYDFVCIDTPPSLGLLTINALTAANKVIVPVQCEYLSMRGLVQLQNTLRMIQENLNPDVQIEGILPTMLDSRTVHAKEAVEILEENFGDLVFKSRIKKAIKFAEAPVKGVPSSSTIRRATPRTTTATGEGGPGEWRGVISGQACARVPSPISSARRPTIRPSAPAARPGRGERVAEAAAQDELGSARGPEETPVAGARARARAGAAPRSPSPRVCDQDAEEPPVETPPERLQRVFSEQPRVRREREDRCRARRATGARSPPTSRPGAASRTSR